MKYLRAQIQNLQKPIEVVEEVVEEEPEPEYEITYYSFEMKEVNISAFLTFEYTTDMLDEQAGANMSMFNTDNFEIIILPSEDTVDLVRVNKKKLEPTISFEWEVKYFRGREVGV